MVASWNMQWSSGEGAGFPIQGSQGQNHWVVLQGQHSLSFFWIQSIEYQELLETWELNGKK